MFRKLGMLLAAACLLLPVQAGAADLVGVYVAPKFVLNIQHFKGVGYDLDGDRLPGSDSKDAARAGGGLGMAFVKTKVNYSYTGTGESENGSFSDTDTVFAGQVGLGCSYAFTDNIAADLGYRFLMMDDGDASISGISMKSKDMYAHQLTLGLRVTF